MIPFFFRVRAPDVLSNATDFGVRPRSVVAPLHLDHIISSRKKLAQDYEEFLRETSLTLPVVPPGHSPVFQSYVVLLPKEDSAFRNDLIARLKEGGVEAPSAPGTCP